MNLRIKTHSMPGDISKQAKQRMLEGREGRGHKAYKKCVRMKERALLKERTKTRLKSEMCE